MAEYSSGAHYISRKRGKSGRGGRRRGAGLLIVVLLLLTAGICLLVILLPSASAAASSQQGGASMTATFYFLATQETSERQAAYDGALSAAARGGAGYVYNDGSYKIIAAAYRREADAQALAEINAGAFCVKYELSFGALEKADRAALSYLTGEWFDALYNAAADLDRGSMTDAQADYAAHAACQKLLRLSDEVESASLRRALEKAGEYSVPTSTALKSYLRYVAVRAIILVGNTCRNFIEVSSG